MDDETHVGFVDPHAKCDGSDHDLDLASHERLQALFTHLCRQSGMVGRGRIALLGQILRQLFRAVA